jgi:uncharacterized repeat protein (TIGR01451 family)
MREFCIRTTSLNYFMSIKRFSILLNRWQRAWRGTLLQVTLLLLACVGAAQAQVVYAVGSLIDPNSGGQFNRFFILNPTTGVATAPAVANSLPAGVSESVAIGVSPINGLVYWVERGVVTPRLGTWNPATGGTAIIGNAGTPATVGSFLRSTFCPDGRFYIAANGAAGGAGAEIYEINPANGALIRTLIVSNLPLNGSGDIVCKTNGDMYMVAQSTNPTATTGPYQLFRATQAQLSTGGTFAASLQGTVGTSTRAINGLSERADGLIVASAALNTTATYVLSTTTGAATTLTTAVGASLADLSREFPRDVSMAKSATPTVALQGRTLTYTVTASNAGPAVAGSVTIADTLNATAFNVGSATWTCTVLSAGSSTAVTTGCGAASGTGNINSYVNLSINSTVQYVIAAPLNSSFTGTVTNTVASTLTGTTVDSTPSNNSATITSTVTPATSLSVTKTDGITTTFAGSTVTYTVTFTNSGPANGSGTVARDVPSAGLSNCTVVSCTGAGTPTAATCPATPANLLTVGGVALPSFPASSTLAFLVRCGVTATGQ